MWIKSVIWGLALALPCQGKLKFPGRGRLGHEERGDGRLSVHSTSTLSDAPSYGEADPGIDSDDDDDEFQVTARSFSLPTPPFLSTQTSVDSDHIFRLLEWCVFYHTTQRDIFFSDSLFEFSILTLVHTYRLHLIEIGILFTPLNLIFVDSTWFRSQSPCYWFISKVWEHQALFVSRVRCYSCLSNEFPSVCVADERPFHCFFLTQVDDSRHSSSNLNFRPSSLENVDEGEVFRTHSVGKRSAHYNAPGERFRSALSFASFSFVSPLSSPVVGIRCAFPAKLTEKSVKPNETRPKIIAKTGQA